MSKNELLPQIVFGMVVESVSEVKGVALKIKHSPGPNASFGNQQLEQRFLMPRQMAEDLRAALDRVLAHLPPRQLNA